MFPNPDYSPARGTQLAVGSFVALNVRLYFALPPLGVGPRLDVVIWTPVPETAIDENGDALPREYKIGSCAELGDRTLVNPIAQPATMRFRTDQTLGRRPFSWHAFHTLRRRAYGCRRANA